jgi:release factor glutamine methyltransferase
MTLQTALRQGAELLTTANIVAPRLTAEVLLAHAVHCDRAYLYAHPEQELREVEWIHFGRYLHERLKRKPTQYITHTQEFYGRPFHVSPAALIPRPETEHLVEIALPFAREAALTIDVGTGSGAIAVTLALEGARFVLATDLSAAALAVACRNARQLKASVDFIQTDALSAFAPGSADLVVSNPPYVAETERDSLQPEVRDWEPALALFAGAGGLAFHQRLIPEAQGVLKPGGRLILELGAGQSQAVQALLGPDWDSPCIYPDLAGIPRVLTASKKPLESGTFPCPARH